jgi:hypothetical protein
VDQSNHVATRKAPWNRSALLKVELPFSEPKLSIDGFCTARCFTAAAAVSEATRHETRADCCRAPQPHSRCRNSNQLETWHSSRGQPSQVEPEERMDNYTLVIALQCGSTAAVINRHNPHTADAVRTRCQYHHLSRKCPQLAGGASADHVETTELMGRLTNRVINPATM